MKRPLHLSAPLLVLAACSPTLPAPDVRITPEQPSTLDDLVAEVTAAEGDAPVTLVYTWSRNGKVVPSIAGASVAATDTARGETWSVQVTATGDQGEGLPGSASVTIANAAPAATVTIEPIAPDSLADLRAVPVGTDADNDPVSFAFAWAKDGVTTTYTGDTVPYTATARGQTWTVTVIPDDGTDKGEPATAEVRVTNGPPEILGVSLTPSPVTAASEITPEIDANDPDGDDITFTYTWTVNGEEASSTRRLTTDRFERNDRIGLTIVPSDGRADGEPYVLDEVVVRNAAPTVGGVTLSPAGDVRKADVLTCAATNPRDVDGDTVTLRYSWQVGTQTIAATSSTLTGASFTRGDTVTCTVTPTDGTTPGTGTPSNTVHVVNSPPVVTDAEIADLAPTPGDPLTLDIGPVVDDDGDTVTLSYAWYVEGFLRSTTDTLPGNAFVREDQVQVFITPNDGIEDGPVFATDLVTVGNNPPEIASLTITPTPLTAAFDAVAVADAFDTNGDPITVTYTWTVDGSTVTGVTGPTLAANRFVRDQTVQVSAVASDGVGVSDTITSDAVTVQNAPPSLDIARISPALPTEASTLRCEPGTWFDADGDSERYSYAWAVNTLTVPVVGSTLTNTRFGKYDQVTCTLIPDDNIDVGMPVTSAITTIGNSLPTASTATLNRVLLREGDTVTASVQGLADLDAIDVPNLTAHVQWWVNDTRVTSVTGSTLDSTHFDKGDQVYARVYPFDGDDEGFPVTTAIANVVNTAPVISTVTIGPNPPSATTPITATVTANDVDPQDVLTYTYNWRVDGSTVKLGTDGVLEASYLFRNAAVQVFVTANDGTANSSQIPSNTLTVGNSAPSTPTVAVTPRWPAAGRDGLRCRITTQSNDVDSDPVTYRFSWTRDGVAHTAGGGYVGPTTTTWTDDTIPAADIADGETWVCTAYATDGNRNSGTATATAHAITVDLASVSAGEGTTCAIAPDRTPRCWGENELGEGRPLEIPMNRIDVGGRAGCGLTASNSVTCWGSMSEAPPTGAWADVQVGAVHACALSPSGTLRCWGTSISGQTTAPNGTWSSLSVGTLHSCALDTLGNPFCWGENGNQQLDAPTGPFVEIAAGGSFSCGLRGDGSITCWGASFAQNVPTGSYVAVRAGALQACGITTNDELRCWGDTTQVQTTPPTGTFVSVSPGAYHACGTRTDGTTVCWGDRSTGATQPPTLPLITASPGWYSTCGITDTNDVVCWGDDDEGQASPPLGLQAQLVRGGEYHTCAITLTGALRCWGSFQSGQTFAPTTGTWLALSTGREHSCALDNTGSIACWGGDADHQVSNRPTSGVWTAVSAGFNHSCAIASDRSMTCWGATSNGQSSAPAGSYIDVAAGVNHTCAVLSNHSLACWGVNSSLQATPPAGSIYDEVVAGNQYSCALSQTGTISCWGNSAYGITNPPTGVFDEIVGGFDHVCATRSSDGRIQCWGHHVY